MSLAKFKTTILSGHKEDAAEVPFDPREKWGLDPEQLRPGRKAFHVQCTIHGHTFSGAVVARSRKFWLLLPAEVEQAAGVKAGDEIAVQMSGG